MTISTCLISQASGFCQFPSYTLDQRSLLARAHRNESAADWSARLGKCMTQEGSKVLQLWNTLLPIVRDQHLVLFGFSTEELSTMQYWLTVASGMPQAPAPAPAAAVTDESNKEMTPAGKAAATRARKARAKKAAAKAA